VTRSDCATTIQTFPEGILNDIDVLLVVEYELEPAVTPGLPEPADTAAGKANAIVSKRMGISDVVTLHNDTFFICRARPSLLINTCATRHYVFTQPMPVVVMQSLGGGKHVSHLSIRIPSEIGAELAIEARHQGITVNAMVNRALERYLSFDRLADFDHSVTLERQIFEKMLENVDVEDLERIAREIGPQTVKRDFVFFNIPATLDNLVSKYLDHIQSMQTGSLSALLCQ